MRRQDTQCVTSQQLPGSSHRWIANLMQTEGFSPGSVLYCKIQDFKPTRI